MFPLTKLTRNHELQFLLFDRTRSLSLFAWSTRGGTICSNRGPAPRTWGGYAQKGRNRWFQQRPRSNDQGAASHCAICLQRHRGPNNFYRPASTFSFHLESIFLSPAELRKFDKGIGDRRDCTEPAMPPPLLVRARVGEGGFRSGHYRRFCTVRDRNLRFSKSTSNFDNEFFVMVCDHAHTIFRRQVCAK